MSTTMSMFKLLVAAIGLLSLQRTASGTESLQLRGSSSDKERELIKPTIVDGFNTTLSCNEIANLDIVGTIGEGKFKITYQVKLPNGQHAIAKRCKSQHCYQANSIRKEADRLSYYREIGIRNAHVNFYGACYRDSHDDDPADFSHGHTAIYELGVPLMRIWSERVCQYCFSYGLTDSDVEDLRAMARSYSQAGILLQNPTNGKTDNKSPRQYALTSAGIRHVDLDLTYDCRNRSDCPTEQMLDINCGILVGGMAQHQHPNCSLAYSMEHPVEYPQEHINLPSVRTWCGMNLVEFFARHTRTFKHTMHDWWLRNADHHGPMQTA